jgi:hypothetical protein
MSNLKRLAQLEARHTAHVEGLAEAVSAALAAVFEYVPDEPLQLIADAKLEISEVAQWYAYLVGCGVPAGLVERLRRADEALWPYVDSPTYAAWCERRRARLEAEARDAAPA